MSVFKEQNQAILEEFAARILIEETLDKAYKSARKGKDAPGDDEEAEENPGNSSKLAEKRKAKEERDKVKKALKKARQKQRKEKESELKAQQEIENAAEEAKGEQTYKADTQTHEGEEDDSAPMVCGTEFQNIKGTEEEAESQSQEARS